MQSVSTAKVHQKLKAAALDTHRNLVYSTDAEKGFIHAYCLVKKRSVGHIKTSNARVNRLAIDSDLQRLYATTTSGIFLSFDISAIGPQLVNSMKLVLRPELGNNYVKQMDLDTNKNIIVVRLKNSDILVLQIIARKDFCTIIERI